MGDNFKHIQSQKVLEITQLGIKHKVRQLNVISINAMKLQELLGLTSKIFGVCVI